MCFSAEASFTAAVVLAVVGYATLRQVSSKNQMLLAYIPLLFAFQQFSEGVLWLFLRNDLYPTFWAETAQNFYLIFARVVWPTWIPLALLFVERVTWRRWILAALLAVGALFSIYQGVSLILNSMTASIVMHSIQYTTVGSFMPISYMVAFYIYVAVVLLPWYISSLKNAIWFGILATIAILAAGYLYEYVFASSWCFFSAIISIIIYKIVKDNRTD